MGKGNSYAELYRQTESSGYEDTRGGTVEGTRAESRESSRPPKHLLWYMYRINEHGSLNLCNCLLNFTAYVINVIFHILSYQLFFLSCSCFNLELGNAR